MINKKYIYSLGGIIMAVAFTGCGAYAERSSEEIRYKYKEKQAKYSIHG